MTEQRSKHTLGALIWRFITGAHMDGIARTDAGFIRKGTRPLTAHGHASPWAHLPRYARAAWRVGILSAGLGALYGWFQSPGYTAAGLAAGAAAAVYLAHRRYTPRVLGWQHRRHTVIPLHRTLSRILEYSHLAETPESRVKVPRDHKDNQSARVRLALPDTWIGNAGQKKEITAVVSRRLGGEWVGTWHQNEHPPYAEFRPAPKPPGKVSLADVKAAMLAAGDDELILGMPAGDTPHKIKLTEPHVALSIRTGGGKTTILRGLIAQGIRKGWHNEIIDPKMVSLNEYSGMVPIHRGIESQMKAIQQYREEMDRRYTEIGESDTEYDGQRWVLWIEEGNSFMEDLRSYWAEYRSSLPPKERESVPKNNPAIADWKYIIYKGRAVKMHAIIVFQRMSGNAVPGGGDIRDQFGIKILNCTPATWIMIIGTRPAPKPSKIRGRVICVIGEDEISVQTTYLSKPEAREYALSGAESDPGGPGHMATVTRLPEPDAERYTLREACGDAQIIPMRYSAARRARARDAEFPAGVKLTYTADELRAWYGNRKRARAA